MQLTPSIISGCLIASILLSSCSLSEQVAPTPQPTVDTNALAAVVVKTIEAQTELNKTQPSAGTQAPTNTPYVITATPGLINTPTPLPAVSQPVALPCNRAVFINDITIPDGTLLASGASFVKTWRVMNMGTCIWNPSYRFLFESGSLLGGPSMINLPEYVNPGQTVDISVPMVAPSSNGTYEGLWEIQDASGNNFGVGANGTSPLDVLVVVGSTPVDFTVRHVTMGVNSSNVVTKCGPGYTFEFSANIFTSAPGKVEYTWVFSNGSRSGLNRLHFSSAGSQTVTTTWALGTSGPIAGGNPYNGWAQIYVDQPNHQYFDEVNFTLQCN